MIVCSSIKQRPPSHHGHAPPSMDSHNDGLWNVGKFRPCAERSDDREPKAKGCGRVFCPGETGVGCLRAASPPHIHTQVITMAAWPPHDRPPRSAQQVTY